MPWKVSVPVNERMRFVTRLEAGEMMSELCREFGISRKSGYRTWDRYRKFGGVGLLDQSRKPITSPKRTPDAVRKLIVDLKREKPHWGASKLRSYLLRKQPDLKLPSRHTLHGILDQNGLVEHTGARRRREGTERFQKNLAQSEAPNELWCADFKGQFKLGTNQYIYPLTITDHFSRYLIACEGLESTAEHTAKSAFAAAFEEYGLPRAIRTDNGTPFASHGLLGLSQLSVWWLRLGIAIERSEPGHPEQNGRHERMHLTLKQQTARPASANFLQQQERFDLFQAEFNCERPHEALAMKTPADFYSRSERAYPRELPEPTYPLHDLSALVYTSGSVALGRQFRFNLSAALAGQRIGLREEDEDLWRVSFMNLDLGFYDHKERQFRTVDLPQPSAEG